MTEEELQPLVDSWREANPNIVRVWWDVDRAVKDCIMQRVPTETHGLHFDYRSAMLFITLPSGRRLAYVKPRIGENQFGGEAVTYMGVGSTKKWERLESYGPKFVENIVQGTARDILCYAMPVSYTHLVVHSETLYKAFCSLPEKQRKVLLFDFWYAWTDGEIAARMEVTTRTVYNLRQRAFKAIRTFYEQGSSEL